MTQTPVSPLKVVLFGHAMIKVAHRADFIVTTLPTNGSIAELAR